MQKDLIIDHIERLLYVVRNAACHRALSQYKEDLNQDYWILIYNNFTVIAILEWCKVFGSKKERTHWIRLVVDHSSFFQDLLITLAIDQPTWEGYRKDIINYRNKYLVHHQKDPNRTHYPSLDIALESSFYYYDWLINKLRLLNIYFVPDDLRVYYDDFLSQVSKFAEVSYQSTKEIKEMVYK